jgi:ABC-type sugar transport system permease subunit
MRSAIADRSPWLTRTEQRLGEVGPLLAFLMPALLILFVAQGYPLWSSLRISFFDWSLARSPMPGPFVGFANYARAMNDGVFVGSILFTVAFALASATLQMLLGLALVLLTVGEGYVLRLARSLLLLPMVVAPVAVGTIWRMMLSARVGVVNTTLAAIGIEGPNWLGDPVWARVSLVLIDAWEWTPFVTVIFAAALASLPAEVLRAATVDGASRWQMFRLVVWPMLLPVALLIAMFRLIDGLLTLDLVFTTTLGGPGFTTHTMSFWIYQEALKYFNISYAAATSWLLLLASMTVAVGLLAWRRRVMVWQAGREA